MRYLGETIDFTQPAGAPALSPADGVAWQVFKNPVALYVGGIAAVLLELAEPRVRTGVWNHTKFRTQPLGRMKRTGRAAMITVYGDAETARRVIAKIGRMHAKVRGTTEDGTPFRADDPDLLDWVQATASFGFLEAYCAFVHPLPAPERDRFYSEGGEASALYGAQGAPRSVAEQTALQRTMLVKLAPHPIISEFLTIVRRAPALPWPLTGLQGPLIRAAISIVPQDVRAVIGLNRPDLSLSPTAAARIRQAGALADRIAVPFTPPVQACRRLGLPGNWLHRRAGPGRLARSRA